MNKKRLYQILSILLLPYRDHSFYGEEGDVIANLRYGFARLRGRSSMSAKEREKWERYYNTSERDLECFLKEHTELYANTLDDFKMLLNLFFPEGVIADSYDQCFRLGAEEKDNIGYFYIDNIFRISRSLLTFRDGKIAIRTWMNPLTEGEGDIFDYPHVFDKVEIWNQLGRMMIPDIFITAFFVEAGMTAIGNLYGQTGGILLADKTLEHVLRKGLAETHLHMNAGIEYEAVWQKMMDAGCWQELVHTEKKYRKIRNNGEFMGFHVLMFRQLFAEYMESDYAGKGDFCAFIEGEYGDYQSMICSLFQCLYQGRLPEYSPAWEGLVKEIYNKGLGEDHLLLEERKDFLFQTIYRSYREYRTYSEMIFLMKSLLYFRENTDQSGLLRLFLQYLRVKNNCFERIMQSNQIQGLTNFRQFYGMMSKTNKNLFEVREQIRIIFRSLSHNVHLKKLEVRITPPVSMAGKETGRYHRSVEKDLKDSVLKHVRNVLEEYLNYFREASGYEDLGQISQGEWEVIDNLCENGQLVFPAVGIIFHFTKMDYVDNRIPDMCWLIYKKAHYDGSKHLLAWRYQMTETARAIEELRSQIPGLAQYIVGIDAASEENKTEPWVFAPVYSAIRNKQITRPLIMRESGRVELVNNIGFTYHVGEEFRHVMSGLRHVDEVIRFFHYKAGDRLGHAIVLGTDIESWMEKNEVVVMPVIEYLENLVWLWGNIVHNEMTFTVSVSIIEGKILELSKMIYGEILGLTPNMLYDAYLEKFKLSNEDTFQSMAGCTIMNITDAEAVNLMEKKDGELCTHFCKYYSVDKPYGLLWTKEKILCTYFCPLYYQKLQQPVMVRVAQSEYSLLKELQEHLVRQVEMKGIYVEVNPTSNLTIGEAENMAVSHILNLNSKGLIDEGINKHEVLVTINSDDPLIFNTSSENELAYIYHALIYKGYKKERVLQWMDKVRQFGMDSSFVKNTRRASEQVKEIEELLEEIEGFLKRVQ